MGCSEIEILSSQILKTKVDYKKELNKIIVSKVNFKKELNEICFLHLHDH